MKKLNLSPLHHWDLWWILTTKPLANIRLDW